MLPSNQLPGNHLPGTHLPSNRRLGAHPRPSTRLERSTFTSRPQHMCRGLVGCALGLARDWGILLAGHSICAAGWSAAPRRRQVPHGVVPLGSIMCVAWVAGLAF